MEKEYIKATEAAEKYNLFFNIYDEHEEPCRRIVVLTKTKELEEVYDENPTEEIKTCKIIQGNLWIRDYSLLTKPDSIDLSKFIISKKLVEELI